MTDKDRALLAMNEAFLGPTLRESMALVEKMERVPLCAVCPAAQWYTMETEAAVASLECFCTEFRGVMYGPTRQVVTVCDGRADAVERATAKRSG